MCEDICHIGRDMTQNRIFGNGGTFFFNLPFWTILSKVLAYNWLYNVIWPLKPGYRHLICGDIYNIGQTMIHNVILRNGGTFHPGLPFSDDFDKGNPSRFFTRMFIFVLVPSNLIMSGVRPDSILGPFGNHPTAQHEFPKWQTLNTNATVNEPQWIICIDMSL